MELKNLLAGIVLKRPNTPQTDFHLKRIKGETSHVFSLSRVDVGSADCTDNSTNILTPGPDLFLYFVGYAILSQRVTFPAMEQEKHLEATITNFFESLHDLISKLAKCMVNR